MKFLDGKYFDPTIDEITTSKRKRDCRGQRSENEMFSCSGPSKRRPRNLKSDTTAAPRHNCPGPEKRRGQGSHSPDVGLLVSASPSRSSPCSAMVEALRRKGVYSLPTNRSSRESNSGSNFIQPSVAGDPDPDVDDHSEYSRKGFQTRFKDPTDSHTIMGCETTTRPSTDSHTTSCLEIVKDKCNCRSEGGLTSSVMRTEDATANTKVAIKQISGVPNPNVVPKRTPASKRKCTPEPPEIKKGVSPRTPILDPRLTDVFQIPDSSSPLAALLRVCADSPTTLAAQKNHALTNDWKFRQDTRASTVIISPGSRETRQLQRNYQQSPSRVSRLLDVPEVEASTRFELVGQGWNNPRIFNDCDVLTGGLCAGYGGNSLYPEQQGEAGSGRGFREQITHYHSNDRASNSHLCRHAAYNQGLRSPGWASEMPDEYAYEIPDEYVYEDSQMEFEEDLFTEVPSDYTPDNRYSWGHTSRDWNEGRQTADFGQSCAVVGPQQAVDIGYYRIQDDEYEYVEHNKHELENETNPGLTRNNFWRRHRLG